MSAAFILTGCLAQLAVAFSLLLLLGARCEIMRLEARIRRLQNGNAQLLD